MREMVFGLDADFTDESFVGRLNADLANDLGNLVSRATTLIVNLGGGTVPALADAPDDVARSWPDLPAAFERALAEASAAMADFAFHRALAAIWEFIGAVNRYVDTTQPWALAKQPDARPRLEHALSVAGGVAAAARHRAGAVPPGVRREDPRRARSDGGADAWPTRDGAACAPARRSRSCPASSRAWTRRKRRAGGAAPGAKAVGADSPRISIDDFGKVELRVAEVLAAEAVPKSKKLLKLTVSLGGEQRTVVSGIAAHYAPADLVGKKIVLVANLEPAKLMGIESNGMVLSGEIDGQLAVLTLDRDLPPGAKVK